MKKDVGKIFKYKTKTIGWTKQKKWKLLKRLMTKEENE